MILKGIGCLLIGIVLSILKVKKLFPYKGLYDDESITNPTYNFRGWIGIFVLCFVGLLMIIRDLVK